MCWQSSVVTLALKSLTPKCIGIFLSYSCIYVWNMKAVRCKPLKLSCQNQSVDNVQLLPWPLTPKCIGVFLSPSWIYVWNPSMKALHWKLHKLFISPKVLTIFSCDLDLWTPKCIFIGIFLSPSCIFVWNVIDVRWKLLKLSCQNQSVDKVQLWPWPLDPKMYRYLPLAIMHLCMKYESCMLKTTQVIVSEPVLTKFSLDLLILNVKVSSFHHPAFMYEIWKLYSKNYSRHRVRIEVLADRHTNKPDSYRAPAQWRGPNK